MSFSRKININSIIACTGTKLNFDTSATQAKKQLKKCTNQGKF